MLRHQILPSNFIEILRYPANYNTDKETGQKPTRRQWVVLYLYSGLLHETSKTKVNHTAPFEQNWIEEELREWDFCVKEFLNLKKEVSLHLKLQNEEKNPNKFHLQ